MLNSVAFSLLAILTSVLAQSSTTVSAATPSPSVYANNSVEFFLRADPIDPTANKGFDGAWLYTYHTGAGENDVTFNQNKTEYTPKAWINYTDGDVGHLEFNLGTVYPWSMLLGYAPYAFFSPVEVNVGLEGPSGFYINETGLQYTSNYASGLNETYNSFGGWLVCDWWHNEPQLFWREKGYQNTAVPCNCAEVYLCPVYV